MIRLTRLGAAALLAAIGLALSAGAADKKKPDPVTYNVTAKELSEEFAKKGMAAEKRYQPAPARGAPALITIDGIVKSVDANAKTVTLDATPKVAIILRAKTISGEKEGKRFALGKNGKFAEFKDKKVIIDFDEIKLQKLPE
jgi:hypothetical protein